MLFGWPLWIVWESTFLVNLLSPQNLVWCCQKLKWTATLNLINKTGPNFETLFCVLLLATLSNVSYLASISAFRRTVVRRYHGNLEILHFLQPTPNTNSIFDSKALTRCLPVLDFWNVNFGSLLQTQKKIDFESNLIFFRVRTWFLLPV